MSRILLSLALVLLAAGTAPASSAYVHPLPVEDGCARPAADGRPDLIVCGAARGKCTYAVGVGRHEAQRTDGPVTVAIAWREQRGVSTHLECTGVLTLVAYGSGAQVAEPRWVTAGRGYLAANGVTSVHHRTTACAYVLGGSCRTETTLEFTTYEIMPDRLPDLRSPPIASSGYAAANAAWHPDVPLVAGPPGTIAVSGTLDLPLELGWG